MGIISKNKLKMWALLNPLGSIKGVYFSEKNIHGVFLKKSFIRERDYYQKYGMSVLLDRKPSLAGIFSALWHIVAEIPTNIFTTRQSINLISFFLLARSLKKQNFEFSLSR